METKKQFRWFTIFEYEKEQDYLQKMHLSGWKFVKVTGLGVYHFEKCTPKNVVYQLDYNKEGLDHKEEYLKMFEDCGWEHLQDYAGYSYFRKEILEGEDPEEIFCDEASKLEMMKRVLNGRMLPLLVIFFACLMPQFLINLFSTHNYIIAAVMGVILASYVTAFTTCFVRYLQFKNKLK